MSDRVKTRKLVATIYRLRSEVVHGGTLEDEVKLYKGEPAVPLCKMLYEAELTIATAIWTVLREGKSPDYHALELSLPADGLAADAT